MNKKSFFIILVTVLTLYIIAFGSVSAQDIDLDGLSNEQLLMLLQSVMQKLEADKNVEPAEQAVEIESEVSETLTAGEPVAEPTETAKKKHYQIYENKKLVVGRMPDSWFIRKPVKSEGDSHEDENGSDGDEIYYTSDRDVFTVTDSYVTTGTWGGISGGITTIGDYSPVYEPAPVPSLPEYSGGYVSVPDYSDIYVK